MNYGYSFQGLSDHQLDVVSGPSSLQLRERSCSSWIWTWIMAVPIYTLSGSVRGQVLVICSSWHWIDPLLKEGVYGPSLTPLTLFFFNNSHRKQCFNIFFLFNFPLFISRLKHQRATLLVAQSAQQHQ